MDCGPLRHRGCAGLHDGALVVIEVECDLAGCARNQRASQRTGEGIQAGCLPRVEAHHSERHELGTGDDDGRLSARTDSRERRAGQQQYATSYQQLLHWETSLNLYKPAGRTLVAPSSASSICMQKFMAGVTSRNTASMDSTRSSPVEPRTSLSRIG